MGGLTEAVGARMEREVNYSEMCKIEYTIGHGE